MLKNELLRSISPWWKFDIVNFLTSLSDSKIDIIASKLDKNKGLDILIFKHFWQIIEFRGQFSEIGWIAETGFPSLADRVK